MDTPPRTFGEDFRRFFLRGLAILLPSVLTLWILVAAYQFIQLRIAEPINRGIRIAMVQSANVWEPLRNVFDPPAEEIAQERARLAAGGQTPPDERALRARLRRDRINAWWAANWWLDAIGILVAIIVVYVAGRLLGGFVGRRLYRRAESVFVQLPVVRQVYQPVKQVVDFLFADEQPIKFSRVVAVEYPRKGIWSVGFLTSDSFRALRDRAGDVVTLFIPSSPTPFTGYTITVPRSEIIELPLTVEEAVRFAVSGGVLVPGGPRELVVEKSPAPAATGTQVE